MIDDDDAFEAIGIAIVAMEELWAAGLRDWVAAVSGGDHHSAREIRRRLDRLYEAMSGPIEVANEVANRLAGQ